MGAHPRSGYVRAALAPMHRCPRRASHVARAASAAVAPVLPLIAPLGDVMRVVWGNEGSLYVELQKQRIRHFEREAMLSNQEVVAMNRQVQV